MPAPCSLSNAGTSRIPAARNTAVVVAASVRFLFSKNWATPRRTTATYKVASSTYLGISTMKELLAVARAYRPTRP